MIERLKLISGSAPLVIEPSNGQETVAGATDVFSYIDSNFEHWGCDAPGAPTGLMPVSVYELAQDGAFAELFGDFGVEPDYLTLTQAQIKQFVKLYPHWLKSGGNGTFFLFKIGTEIFVAAVFLFSDGRIGVRLRRFSLERVFRAIKLHRLVVPQLKRAR